MGFIFNRITFLVIISIIVTFSLSMNEVVKFAQRSQARGTEQYVNWLNIQQTRFSSQEACQKATYQVCEFKQCEYQAADGSVEEVCGTTSSKRWSPTNISIPGLYQKVISLTLTIASPTIRNEFSINVPQDTLTYSLLGSSSPEPIVQTKTISSDEILRAINSVLLYDLSAGIDIQPQPSGETSYMITVTGSSAGDPSEEKTIGCATSTCPRTFRSVLRTIVSLWDPALVKTLLPPDSRDLL